MPLWEQLRKLDQFRRDGEEGAAFPTSSVDEDEKVTGESVLTFTYYEEKSPLDQTATGSIESMGTMQDSQSGDAYLHAAIAAVMAVDLDAPLLDRFEDAQSDSRSEVMPSQSMSAEDDTPHHVSSGQAESNPAELDSAQQLQTWQGSPTGDVDIPFSRPIDDENDMVREEIDCWAPNPESTGEGEELAEAASEDLTEQWTCRDSGVEPGSSSEVLGVSTQGEIISSDSNQSPYEADNFDEVARLNVEGGTETEVHQPPASTKNQEDVPVQGLDTREQRVTKSDIAYVESLTVVVEAEAESEAEEVEIECVDVELGLVESSMSESEEGAGFSIEGDEASSDILNPDMQTLSGLPGMEGEVSSDTEQAGLDARVETQVSSERNMQSDEVVNGEDISLRSAQSSFNDIALEDNSGGEGCAGDAYEGLRSGVEDMADMDNNVGGRFVYKPEQELTIYRAQQVLTEFVATLDQYDEFDLDLSEVEEIDTAGIQLLLLLRNEARKRKKHVYLVSSSSSVDEVIALCHLKSVFHGAIA